MIKKKKKKVLKTQLKSTVNLMSKNRDFFFFNFHFLRDRTLSTLRENFSNVESFKCLLKVSNVLKLITL